MGETVYHHSSIDGTVSPVEITAKNYGTYSVPCDACAQTRIDRHRQKYQDFSELTDEERGYRLSKIVTNGRQDTTLMVQACREMVAKKTSMLTIWGSSGNAKSLALIATVNEFLDMGIPAMYIPSYDLLNWIQDGINERGDVKNESAYARLERCKGIVVLAIDELQGIKISDWRLEQLRNIIDRRWRDGIDGKTATLFAMNEDPENLEPRIYSRLKDGRNRADGKSPILLNDDVDMRPLLRRKS